MKKKSYTEACPKLEESQRLDPQDGTLLNLAVCHSREGKTASAWAEFQTAVQQAREAKRKDREVLAKRELRRLERRLSRLTIDVPSEARVPGLSIKRAGSVVGSATWGTAVPVDPGTVTIEMTAPGYKQRSLEVAIAETEDKTVALEKLEALPKPPAPKPKKGPKPDDGAREEEESRRSRRMWAYIAGGAGLAAVGVGSFFGLRAMSKNSDSDEHCNGSLCDPEGLELAEEAESAATVSNVAFALGAVGIGAGAYLFFTSTPPSKEKPVARRGKMRVSPAVGADGASIVVTGVW